MFLFLRSFSSIRTSIRRLQPYTSGLVLILADRALTAREQINWRPTVMNNSKNYWHLNHRSIGKLNQVLKQCYQADLSWVDSIKRKKRKHESSKRFKKLGFQWYTKRDQVEEIIKYIKFLTYSGICLIWNLTYSGFKWIQIKEK